MRRELKPVRWIGSSYRDLKSLPTPVRRAFGFALDQAQRGGKHPEAKPLKGFGGAGVLEVMEDYRGGTFRAVYTVRFFGVLYVLHVFQKKSKRGIETPQADIERIGARLKEAEIDYETFSTTEIAEQLS